MSLWNSLAEWSEWIFEARGLTKAQKVTDDMLFVISEAAEATGKIAYGPFANLVKVLGDAADALVDMSSEQWKRTNPHRHNGAQDRLEQALSDVATFALDALEYVRNGESPDALFRQRGVVPEQHASKEIGQAILMLIRTALHLGGNPIAEVERWANQ